MTLIAVTQRTDIITEYNETRDSLDQRWHEFLLICDLTPLIIPNNLEIAKKIINTIKLDGVLLTGGNDPLERKNTENFLLDLAIEKKIPVLGVCHGMQRIQTYFGTVLKKIPGHIMEKQKIFIGGLEEEVNSYHHYGTTEHTNGFDILARSDDGVIKAIQHQYLPIKGIMWHPERYTNFKESDIKLLTNIFFGVK
ncbi:MAG: gamma-glutamyl-gamma-aminobutyrate hydrolase family protein [Coxiellaceae bacterium]|nr:gamma-glutamyl-gamma-aminobutyrate hydrolase family protein [Coxiellaceae bacterium]